MGTVDDTIFYAEKCFYLAERQLKCSQDQLKLYQEMKNSASLYLENKIQNYQDISHLNTIQKSIEDAKYSESVAEKCLSSAEKQVRLHEETLKTVKNFLNLLKREV